MSDNTTGVSDTDVSDDAIDETTAERFGDAPVGDAPSREQAPSGQSGDAAGAEVDVTEDPRSKEELLTELQEAESDRDQYLDDLKRARAEFQNYRKRIMREGAEQRQTGVAEVLERLVDVLDDFELAVLATSNEAGDQESLRKGVEMVYGKFVDVCRSFGLERIGEEGVPFDPERHEAVQQVEGDEKHDEPIVVEVMRPGYMANGRVLRAAMVKVEK